MVHVSNLYRSPHDNVHARCGGARFAVDESRSNDTGNNARSSPSNLNAMDEAPSTSRIQEEEEEEEEGEGGRRAEQDDVPSSSSADWLRLGLGGASSSAEAVSPGGRRQAPTELQLFVDRPSSSSSPAAPPWRSSSTPAAAAAQFTSQPGTSAGPAEGRSGMRVVSPPRRQTGIWLMLQAAALQPQGRQPYLPQIPRNYLRIKDESMTIRLLMRYLADKLGLEDDLEVEITCRDQVLLPSMTLQQVRDNIWYSGDAPPVLPDSPSIDHVMTLQYRRSTSTSGSH